jgi:hypothetical protein
MSYHEIIISTLHDHNPIRVVRIGSLIKIEQLDEHKRVAEDVRLHMSEVNDLIQALKDLWRLKS